MKYSEAKYGRVFVIRLEHGDVVHETIEKFAIEHQIRAAALVAVGGADTGSEIIVGAEKGDSLPPNPMAKMLAGAHEIAGTGTLFPDEDGNPALHMHMACGRNESTITGCVRNGVKTWHIIEVILFELTETPATRQLDPALGFKLLQP
jgi:predicted DNA-binding protein with PD1-like motif